MGEFWCAAPRISRSRDRWLRKWLACDQTESWVRKFFEGRRTVAHGFIDLHMHSTASDGTLSPTALVLAAHEAGLSAISLTDHDTVGGIAEAVQAASNVGIDFLAGIEITCECPAPGTLHMLGYGVDPGSESITSLHARLSEERAFRARRIVQRLCEIGLPLDFDEVASRAKGVIGRPHIADAMVARSYVRNRSQAFKEYLARGGKAFVDKTSIESREAIEVIHRARGIAVVAHPTQLRCGNFAELELRIRSLVDQGLDGIEVLHSDHSPAEISAYTDIARKLKLLTTGGSDFHGSGKPRLSLGRVAGRRVNRDWFDRIVEALARRAASG
jgi:predicted metal-dependent phosphoesterase TrpH